MNNSILQSVFKELIYILASYKIKLRNYIFSVLMKGRSTEYFKKKELKKEKNENTNITFIDERRLKNIIQ